MRFGSAAVMGGRIAPAGLYIAPAGQLPGENTTLMRVPAGNPCRVGETPNTCYARLLREGVSSASAQDSANAARIAAESAGTSDALRTVEALFGRTAGSIDAAIASGNAIEIERIRLQAIEGARQTQLALANATSTTEAAVLRERLAALQMVQQITSQNSISGKTALYVAGGVAVVAVLGLGYMALRPKSRSNPVIGRGRRRRYVKPSSKRRARRRA